ncbi:MAG: hypothetical protein VZQ98_04650 [Bacteroidales bacterium]|nr:hypothetical protein [Bacteroidales bacterium]
MKKRHIISWVLLTIFSSMLLFSSLHVHDHSSTSTKAETECADCVKHQCHGHFSQLPMDTHPCVLCQFLLLTFLASAISAYIYSWFQIRNLTVPSRHRAYLSVYGVISLRAPPAV